MATAGSPLNAFSVDLEDWFQGLTSTNPRVEQWPQLQSRVVPATQRLLAILRTYEIQATFFVLGHVADSHPELIQSIQAEGHEIAVHGYWHGRVSRMTSAEFARELECSVRAIERVTGQMPVGHRAPYFSLNHTTPWAFDVLREQGFRYDSSIFPIRNGYYGDPDAPRFPYMTSAAGLVEFPLSTVRVGRLNLPMAGGFYLRVWPYAFVHWAIRSLHRDGKPVVLYMHPWELDLEQPPHPVTPRERITHFAGRGGLEAKLHRLFGEFRFASLRTLLEQSPSFGPG